MRIGILAPCSLLISSCQNSAGIGIDDIVRSSTSGKRVRQIVIDVPTVRAGGERDLVAGQVPIDCLGILMGNAQHVGDGELWPRWNRSCHALIPFLGRLRRIARTAAKASSAAVGACGMVTIFGANQPANAGVVGGSMVLP